MAEPDRLPHAYPFRMISQRGSTGRLAFSASSDDAWSQGGSVPASIVLEALAQAGGVLAASGQSSGGVLIQVARFRCPRPVNPGDVLDLSAEVLTRMGPLLRVRVVARRDGKIVARGILSLRETGP